MTTKLEPYFGPCNTAPGNTYVGICGKLYDPIFRLPPSATLGELRQISASIYSYRSSYPHFVVVYGANDKTHGNCKRIDNQPDDITLAELGITPMTLLYAVHK
jgi:hypothetical protein